MTTRPCPCPLDGAAIDQPGASLCGGCTTNLRMDLDAVPRTLTELDLAITRQTAMPPASGVPACPEGCDHGPAWADVCVAGVSTDLDIRASDARLALATLLHGWARVLEEEHPLPPVPAGPLCGDAAAWTCQHPSCRALHVLRHATTERAHLVATTAGQARILRLHLPLIAGAMWLPDLARELSAALNEATAAVDRPADARLAGACATCRKALYATEGALRATCSHCGTRQDVPATRAAAVAEAEHARQELLPKPDIARLLGVAVGTLHRWSSEGRIHPEGINTKGQNLYRVGPIADALRAGTAPPRAVSA